MKKLFVGLAGALSVIYLVNPTAGFLELLPDNIPFIGNLDEATATAVLIAALRYFGYDIGDLFGSRKAINFDKNTR